MIRVVLAEDEPLLRSGLRLLLERDGQIAVVAEVADGAAAVAAVRRHRPHVLLVDLRMPVLGGVDTIRALRQDPELKDTPTLVLTTFDSDEDVIEALRVGANGYLLKDVHPEELRGAVRSIASGTPVVSPSVLATMLRTVAQSRPPRAHILDRFTARERDVLAAVGRGLSNNEIAAELNLSGATVRTYVSRMLTHSGLRDRSQLVILAYESGLVRGDG
jgi:DNA-binding NarL/FixJ family response regulator